MDSDMYFRPQLILILATSTLLTACGGGGSDSAEKNGDLGTTGAPDASASVPHRLLSIAELQSRLPEVESNIATMDGEGLWLIQSSTESHARSVNTEDTYDATYYNHGTQIVAVREQDGEYYTTLCAAPLEFHLGEDAPLSIDGNTLTYEHSRNDVLLSRHSEVALAIELNSDHRYFHGRFEHSLNYNDGAKTTYDTNLAGVKISNSNTLTDAASAFDIDFYLRVNSAESTLADLSDEITCLGGSAGVGAGSENGLSIVHEEDYGSAFTSSSDKVEFFYQDITKGDSQTQDYIFNQSIINGQGDPFADGSCNGCTPYKTGSLIVELNPESTQLAASGTGTDVDDETIEWRFSISIP